MSGPTTFSASTATWEGAHLYAEGVLAGLEWERALRDERDRLPTPLAEAVTDLVALGAHCGGLRGLTRSMALGRVWQFLAGGASNELQIFRDTDELYAAGRAQRPAVEAVQRLRALDSGDFAVVASSALRAIITHPDGSLEEDPHADEPRVVRETQAVASSLEDAVIALAECPCDRHQSEMSAALREVDEIFFGATAPRPGPVAPGNVQLIQAHVHGRTLLHGFCTLASAHQRYPGVVVGLTRDEAMKTVLDDPAIDGLMLSAAPADHAWVALLRGEIEKVLATAEQAM